jgi:serine/threonine-protein kinase
MNEPEPPAPEETFASLLAAWDEALASGKLPADADPAGLPPELRRRLEEALPWVELLQQLRPSQPSTFRGGRPPSGGSTLQPGSAEAAASPAAAVPQVGRFRILRPLGQGAHGMVFLAHDPLLGREVALKVPRAEALVTPELRERFHREARAASGLDHPNVVPVHEAGADGPVCYIASAYCPGISLAQWLREREGLVPAGAAAALLAALADGVQHAHGRGVIHRDLKPSNVLLAEGGVPRITDFGLAKLLAADDSQQTETGAILGTPSYMAPEQAAGGRAAVGPTADVYALGAILYEVLTGRPPFRGESGLEILMQARTCEPVPPGRLRPGLPRDLETICLKCLEKDPQRRYRTARELADDLGRFQRGEPIAARPAGRRERLVKWARRRPALAGLIAVAASAAAALAALGTLYHLDREASYAAVLKEKETALRERAKAEEERGKAEKNFRAAEKQRRRADSNLADALGTINAFHVRLSEGHLLNQPGQKAARLEVLREAAQFYRKLIREQSDSPAVRAELGVAYLRLAMITGELETHARGIRHAREGVAILEKLAREQPTGANTRSWLRGLLILGRLQVGARQMTEAERVARKTVAGAVELARRAPRDPQAVWLLASAHTHMGDVHGLAGRLREAESSLREALEVLRRSPRPAGGRDLTALAEAQALGRLAVFYREVGQTRQAEAMFQKALGLHEQVTRASPGELRLQQDLASCQGLFGDLYKTTGQLAEARKLYFRALDLWEKRAEEHPGVPEYQYFVARTHLNLGDIYLLAGQLKAALARYMKGAGLAEKLFARHPLTPEYRELEAALHAARAGLALRVGRTADALAGMSRAVDIQTRLVEDYPDIQKYARRLATLIANVGLVQQTRGQLDLAEASYEKALAMTRRQAQQQPLLAEIAVQLGGLLCNLGHLRREQNRPREALDYYEKAQAALAPVWARHRAHLEARSFLRNVHAGRAEALRELGRYKEALAEWDRAMKLDTAKARPAFLAGRALARTGLGDHAGALADVESAARQEGVSPEVAYELAAASALAAAAARKDAALAETTREAAAGRCAAWAVKLLARAREAGYFRTVRRFQAFFGDARFAALRQRADYREFADSLRAPADPSGPTS